MIASPFEFKKALPKSSAQALKGVCDIPSSQLPQAIVKEDRLSITIPEDEYRVGLEECNNNLHGKILWPKGISPFSIFYLHKKLAIIWSAQCAIVIHMEIIHLFNAVWMARNNNRFKGKVIPISFSINFIFAASSISGNNTKLALPLGIKDFPV
ncbi:hypothetical protein KIW84_056146 [Lathyrus oleraceus]|uniref:Uncharacterized protein n=1 Tax=Pisum sativum TaxID=3888 RepID=A0A9D4WXF8_PEA|nr:hypothetical protein KIW84_056146 [Pisum sativum]